VIIANRCSGWDWGPILTTCGPWKEVRLESYQARVKDLIIGYEVNSGLNKVTGKISAVVEGTAGDRVKFSASLGDEVIFNGSADLDDQGKAELEFHVSNPKLWYPHGYGDQPLYTVGKTFYFRVNGVDVFCGGSDWIPADSFVSAEDITRRDVRNLPLICSVNRLPGLPKTATGNGSR
jgi:beta-mannosidase